MPDRSRQHGSLRAALSGGGTADGRPPGRCHDAGAAFPPQQVGADRMGGCLSPGPRERQARSADGIINMTGQSTPVALRAARVLASSRPRGSMPGQGERRRRQHDAGRATPRRDTVTELLLAPGAEAIGSLPAEVPVRFASLASRPADPPPADDRTGSDAVVEIVLVGGRRLQFPAGIDDAAQLRLIRVTEAA